MDRIWNKKEASDRLQFCWDQISEDTIKRSWQKVLENCAAKTGDAGLLIDREPDDDPEDKDYKDEGIPKKDK
jgi:hypothetical protein